jgi:hypothetical protein
VLNSIGRKIGCDRTPPPCQNYQPTGRVYQGYGMKLVWADKPTNGEDRLQRQRTNHSRSFRENVRYINVTFKDLYLHHRLQHNDLGCIVCRKSAGFGALSTGLPPLSLFSSYPGFRVEEGHLTCCMSNILAVHSGRLTLALMRALSPA